MVVVESIGAASDSSTTNNTPGGTGLFLSPSATTPIRPHGIPVSLLFLYPILVYYPIYNNSNVVNTASGGCVCRFSNALF